MHSLVCSHHIYIYIHSIDETGPSGALLSPVSQHPRRALVKHRNDTICAAMARIARQSDADVIMVLGPPERQERTPTTEFQSSAGHESHVVHRAVRSLILAHDHMEIDIADTAMTCKSVTVPAGWALSFRSGRTVHRGLPATQPAR
jgi:hypothetical protein